MKRGFCFLLLVIGVMAVLQVHAQTEGQEEKLNLPGDNLNLYAVMKMFQESETLEIFEKKLNEEDNRINNLDLNGDDQIDYIRVLDEVDGDVHNIILQVALNEKEKQDIAVFTVEKIKDGQVRVQLTGDEELYGKDYIIEPNMTEGGSNGRPNPGYTGKTQKIEDKIIVANSVPQTEIATWPVVVYMYQPTYVVWHSPWYYGYYPPWPAPRPTPSKPTVTRPAPERPSPTRPSPTRPAPSKPTPAKPGVERPATRPTRPVTKPAPSTRPAAKPAARPAKKPGGGG